MALHLVKLCVGVERVDDLERWIQQRVREGRLPSHTTRMSPKRANELLDGGSLYWVIKHQIQARQRIVSLDDHVGEDGIKRCEITLDSELVRTAPSPKRPFQGWRYLKAEQAPQDLTQQIGGEDLPNELQQKLIELGAW